MLCLAAEDAPTAPYPPLQYGLTPIIGPAVGKQLHLRDTVYCCHKLLNILQNISRLALQLVAYCLERRKANRSSLAGFQYREVCRRYADTLGELTQRYSTFFHYRPKFNHYTHTPHPFVFVIFISVHLRTLTNRKNTTKLRNMQIWHILCTFFIVLRKT